MKIDEQKLNGQKNRWAKAHFKYPTVKRRLPQAGLRRETRCFDSLQGDKRMQSWQQSFNRWWDLTFGNEERDRLVTGKICRSLEILRKEPEELISTHLIPF